MIGPFAGHTWIQAIRALLAESSEAASGRLPDLAGVVILCVALSALALAIAEGRDWGWTDARVVGAFVIGLVLLPLFVWRSASHPTPLLDLSPFRIRTFSVANLAALTFSVAFYGQVLAGSSSSRRSGTTGSWPRPWRSPRRP